MRFLSWGCGVQSTTLGEMSAQGELEPLDAVLTADPGWERQATYEAREFYMRRWRAMGMRVEIVSAGDIRQLGAVVHIHIPFWTSDGGPLRRQCTKEFKLKPLKRRIRELLGYHATKPPHPKPGSAEVWLGISLDEWTRAKPSRTKFMVNRWPLLENKRTRQGCVNYLESRGLPVPVKSACIGCPYRSASEWIEMREEAPEEFASVVAFDEKNRHNPLADRGGGAVDELFIYKHGGSLADADLEFDAANERQRYGIQIPFMVCESGHCWV